VSDQHLQQLTRCGQPVKATTIESVVHNQKAISQHKFVTLQKKGSRHKPNILMESVPFVYQLRAQQNMNIGNVIKRNPNLSNFNNKKGMLTATIEQKCSASIKHRAFQCAAHIQQF